MANLLSRYHTPSETAHVDATGALKVIIQSAHILKACRWSRTPSPFVSIHVNGSEAVTHPQDETYDPSWLSQTFYLLVTNPTEEVQLVLYDHRSRHVVLGVATFDLSLVTDSSDAASSKSDSGIALNTRLSILKGKQRRGDLLCSFIYFPISTTLPEEKSNVGIVHIILSGVDSLLPSDRFPVMAAVRLAWDLPPIYTTPRLALSNGSATWGTTHEFLCFDKATCVVYIDVLNYQESVGHVHIFLVDLLEATVRSGGTGTQCQWPLSGSSAGRLIVSAEWRALDLG